MCNLNPNEEDNLVVNAFLAFLAKDMSCNIRAMDNGLFDCMDALVGHIEPDLNEDLGEESLL
jgi:hypothetical protein